MSFLFSFKFTTFFEDDRYAAHPQRWENLAWYVAKRLRKISVFLEENGLPFEAGEAEDLDRRFREFSNLKQGTGEGLCELWEDLMSWSEQSVVVQGREYIIANIACLPNPYTI